MTAVSCDRIALQINMYHTQQNKLTILIDPLYIHTEASQQLIHNQVAIHTVLHYLKGIVNNKVSVEVVFPKFLWSGDWKERYQAYVPADNPFYGDEFFKVLENKEPLPEWAKQRVEQTKSYLETKKEPYLKFEKFQSTPEGLKKLLDSMKDGTLFMYRDADYLYHKGFMELIDIYFAYECDLLLTANRVLHAEKKKLNSDYRLFPVNYPEIFEEIETFLKGHHIYISHANPIYGLQMAVFYPMTDTKLMEYQISMNKILGLKKDAQVYQYFRSMFYHRYSFIRYAIDQIKFNMFQAERLEDNGLRASHYFLASYHLNSFYLNLWGFIDNLAWVINHLYDLGFNIEKTATKVSFISKDYLKKLKEKKLDIYNLLKEKENKDWLANLADKRHPAAHREPLFMSPVYDKNDMSLIAEGLIVVNTKKGQEMFKAINHMNYDFEQLLKFTDNILKLLESKA